MILDRPLNLDFNSEGRSSSAISSSVCGTNSKRELVKSLESAEKKIKRLEEENETLRDVIESIAVDSYKKKLMMSDCISGSFN